MELRDQRSIVVCELEITSLGVAALEDLSLGVTRHSLDVQSELASLLNGSTLQLNSSVESSDGRLLGNETELVSSRGGEISLVEVVAKVILNLILSRHLDCDWSGEGLEVAEEVAQVTGKGLSRSEILINTVLVTESRWDGSLEVDNRGLASRSAVLAMSSQWAGLEIISLQALVLKSVVTELVSNEIIGSNLQQDFSVLVIVVASVPGTESLIELEAPSSSLSPLAS